MENMLDIKALMAYIALLFISLLGPGLFKLFSYCHPTMCTLKKKKLSEILDLVYSICPLPMILF